MILNSWKEIASYLGISVRTAQRFEHFGLPIRRPAGHPRSAVIAMSDEVDAWCQRAQNGTHRQPTVSERGQMIRTQSAELRKQLAECRARSESLRMRAREIRTQKIVALRAVIGTFVATI
jgi:hypothetical protein